MAVRKRCFLAVRARIWCLDFEERAAPRAWSPCRAAKHAGGPGGSRLRGRLDAAGSGWPRIGTSASPAGPLRTLRGRSVMAHSAVAL